MSVRFPRLAAAALLFAGALTVGAAAPAFAENSPTVIPVAVNDSYSMMGGTTLSVDAIDGLLANDLHAADWTIIFVEAVQNDVPGELTLESTYKNGGFTYTPDPAFSGERTFEYQVRDGDLGVVSDNWALVTITVLDPTLPCEAGTPGCEAPDPGPGDGTDIPCAVGAPGCPPPTTIPPCDPNGPEMEAPGPGEEPTCIGEPTPGDGTDIPCAVGAPGCPPPADSTVPTVADGDPGAPKSVTEVQLETLAYTGATVDYRLLALAALLLVGGVALVVPRRRTA